MKTAFLISIIAAIGISLTLLAFIYQYQQNCRTEGGSLEGILSCDKSRYDTIQDLFQKKYGPMGGSVTDGTTGSILKFTATNSVGDSATLLVKENQNGPYYAEITCRHKDSGKTETITENIVSYLENDDCFRNTETSLPINEQLNFTKIQFENGCTKDRICYGVFENGTRMRISCDDIPQHGCGVISFDKSIMPDDFGLVYSFGVGGKNTLDTKKKLYRADMICEPQIEINLELSHDDLYQIWDVAHKNDFLL